jgi:hypothetical protein
MQLRAGVERHLPHPGETTGHDAETHQSYCLRLSACSIAVRFSTRARITFKERLRTLGEGETPLESLPPL